MPPPAARPMPDRHSLHLSAEKQSSNLTRCPFRHARTRTGAMNLCNLWMARFHLTAPSIAINLSPTPARQRITSQLRVVLIDFPRCASL